jgi:hypothetical protein
MKHLPLLSVFAGALLVAPLKAQDTTHTGVAPTVRRRPMSHADSVRQRADSGLRVDSAGGQIDSTGATTRPTTPPQPATPPTLPPTTTDTMTNGARPPLPRTTPPTTGAPTVPPTNGTTPPPPSPAGGATPPPPPL